MTIEAERTVIVIEHEEYAGVHVVHREDETRVYLSPALWEVSGKGNMMHIYPASDESKFKDETHFLGRA